MLSTPVLDFAMELACAEARQWLGATSPNPPVGAVVLDEHGQILACAAHQKAGTAHAERALIDQCRTQGLLERIHTLCVTLAPCNHYGRTPPCCDAILEAGIKRVVIGTPDPNAFVNNDGIERLQTAGVEILVGVQEELCRQLIYSFAYSVTTNQPWITLKRAIDERGTMLPPAGQKTFTSPSSLRLAHRLRKRADVILTGSGTILADDPLFTVRGVPDHANKSRLLAILDRRRRVPVTWLKQAEKRGFVPIIYDDLDTAIADLGARQSREILVEAGPRLSQALLSAGLWTMDVAIHKGVPDRVDVTFNPATKIPFDTYNWQWENMLPYEGDEPVVPHTNRHT